MCRPSVRPVASSASQTGVYDRIVERALVVRVRPCEPRDETAVADPVRLAGGFVGVLHRERADSLETVGRNRAPLGDPVVVDRARLHRERRVGDAAELEAEAGVHHRDVDPLGVEHLHPLVGIEPGRVAVLVVPALAEVLVALPRVAEADETTFGRHRVLDETFVETGRLVPAQPDPAIAHRRREVPLPQVGGLAQVPVGIDDVLGAALAVSMSQDRRNPVPVSTGRVSRVCSAMVETTVCVSGGRARRGGDDLVEHRLAGQLGQLERGRAGGCARTPWRCRDPR